MIRYSIVTFILSFFALILMYGLYVYIPSVLGVKYAQTKVGFDFTPQPTPTPTLIPTPTPALTPVTIIIPKLKIQTVVEPVGVTETGNMDVPKNANNVAWYSYGVSPAEDGNSVLAGHFDTPTGKPAIFYNLRKLETGDEIEIISINGIHSVFEVIEKSSIPYDVFPSEEIFKTRPGKNLNLITCGGIWDFKKKTYTNRIVVYTTLKEIKS